MHLDVLPRRDVALLERHPALDPVGERLELLRRDPAPRQLDADHLNVGLALTVHPLLEAELDELGLLRRAGEVPLGLIVEVVELALEDRDDVPGDILADLRVGERPLAAVRGRWLHPLKVPKGARLS